MIGRSFAVAAVFCAVPMFAQTPPASPPADVAIMASVRAKELRFDEVPRVTVTFFGAVNGLPNITVWKTDRTNLPDQVQPNVTYRDIGVLLTITSTLPNIEQILDEALGAQTRPASPPTPAPKPEDREN